MDQKITFEMGVALLLCFAFGIQIGNLITEKFNGKFKKELIAKGVAKYTINEKTGETKYEIIDLTKK